MKVVVKVKSFGRQHCTSACCTHREIVASTYVCVLFRPAMSDLLVGRATISSLTTVHSNICKPVQRALF